MDLEGVNIAELKPIRRSTEIAAELLNGIHIGSLGCRR
jgi:hypothetical protein